MSTNRILEISKIVPLCIHSLKYCITHPPVVNITLKGPRAALKTIDWKNLAAHIDFDQISQSPPCVSLTTNHLSLPNTIKLISYTPSPLSLEITPL
jgi:hypothetical protein